MELFLAFLLSKNFALLLTTLATLLSILVGYVKNKGKKDVIKTVISGIEIANSPETKEIIKEISQGYSKIKTINFENEVKQITEGMKTNGVGTVKDVIEDLEKGIKSAETFKNKVNNLIQKIKKQ